MPKPTCSFEGCNRPNKAKTLCDPHYSQLKRGRPLTPIWIQDAPLKDRVARHSTHGGPIVPGRPEMGRCWQWFGCKRDSVSGTQYGMVRYRGKTMGAHRLSWMAYKGDIPNGMEIDHICHNSLCVNPDHLRLATRKQNVEHLRGAKSNNKSTGIRNVYPNRNRWQVLVAGKYFGNFATIEEASEVAAKARAELFDFPDF